MEPGLQATQPSPPPAATPTTADATLSLPPTRGAHQPIMHSDRRGFVRRWSAPALAAVYVPATLAELAGCVQAALENYGSDVKITSGRHCYEDFVYNASTRAIIDMSALCQVGFDPQRQAFFVDAGCECWQVYRALHNGWGKTVSAGSCYSVGMGGHIAGGGYGLLSRLHGLTIDHLSGADIVTWDAAARKASLRHVCADSASAAERDLFWALCGAGGGNFGAIGRFYFASLPDSPEHASIWQASWDWAGLNPAGFDALLADITRFMLQLPDSDFALLKLQHVAAGQIRLIVQMTSPAGTSLPHHCARVERELANARTCMAAPTSASVQHLSYLEAVQSLNGSGPNQCGKYKSAYMKKLFPADQSAAIYRWLHTTPPGIDPAAMNQSLLQVDSYGAAINRQAANATAVPQRSSILKLQYQTYWDDDAQANAHLQWIEGFYREVYAEYGGTPDPRRDASGTVDGAYYNYPDAALGTHQDGRIDEALWLYFLDNYRNNARNLVKVKQQWDPENRFNHAQSIPVR